MANSNSTNLDRLDSTSTRVSTRKNSETTDRDEPTSASVADFLLYGLSLPERTLRSTTAVVGGVLRESSSLLVPQAFRSSKSYSMLIEQNLDFLIRDVGGVESGAVDAQSNQQVENFVARKAVGGFIEMASLPLLHVSPMTVLAIVSDVAYGSQTYLKELSDELKAQGVIDENTTIDHTADLLKAIKDTSASAADVFDSPPLSVDGLTNTIEQVQAVANSLDPSKVMPWAEVERLWNEMHVMAQREHVNIMDISNTMSMYAMKRIGTLRRGVLSSISVAGNMFDRHILNHYATGLEQIQEKGIYAALADSSKPYVAAMWSNFSSERETFTEDFLSGQMAGRAWNGMKNWLGGGEGSLSSGQS